MKLRRLTMSDAAEVERLYIRERRTVAVTAKILGCSPNQVAKLMRHLHLKPRRNGWNKGEGRGPPWPGYPMIGVEETEKKK